MNAVFIWRQVQNKVQIKFVRFEEWLVVSHRVCIIKTLKAKHG